MKDLMIYGVLVLLSVLVIALFPKSYNCQQFVPQNGAEGKVRITKTCGAGKRNAAQMAEMNRRMEEKKAMMRKKKKVEEDIKSAKYSTGCIILSSQTNIKIAFISRMRLQ